MKYGYARVSTDGQSVAAQVAALKAVGSEKVFREVASGAKTDRAQLRKAITALGAGDVLMVTRLDRLARATRDLLNTLAAITGKKAGFRSLSDTWADTTTPMDGSCSPCSVGWRSSSGSSSVLARVRDASVPRRVG
jgi:DNA invertase Pin-like site-specific DNA recombinase